MEVPTEPESLRDWFRALKDQSGLSFAAIAQAIGEEERNVKRWMAVDVPPKIPRGDVVLRLLSALGVTFTPPAPETVRAVNAKVEELRELLAQTHALLERARDAAQRDRLSVGRRLKALETTVGREGAGVTQILEGLEADVVQIRGQLEAQAAQASRTRRTQ